MDNMEYKNTLLEHISNSMNKYDLSLLECACKEACEAENLTELSGLTAALPKIRNIIAAGKGVARAELINRVAHVIKSALNIDMKRATETASRMISRMA